jgi:hypothetical protein
MLCLVLLFAVDREGVCCPEVIPLLLEVFLSPVFLLGEQAVRRERRLGGVVKKERGRIRLLF